MRAVVQRVTRASVTVDGEVLSSIGEGWLVLLGVAEGDDESDADMLADKVVNLRIFRDDEGKMNRSVIDTGGDVIAVSQFTLMGDARKGRRPSFIHACEPERANALYEYFCAKVTEIGIRCGKGKFQAMMDVELVNDGPVTILLDSKKVF